MIVCQLDSKTKQLAVAQSGFGVLYSPFLALGMAFLLGFRSSACPVWGGRSWLQTPSNGSVIRLGQGLVSRCRARHFCRVDHSSAGWSSSSPVQKFHFQILFIPLFSVACEFYFVHSRFWSDKCFMGEPAASSMCECAPPEVMTLGHAGRCQCGSNETFRIPLYEQLRDCRSQSLYWVSYL